MHLWDYMLSCLGGRLDWVPFSHLLKNYSFEVSQTSPGSRRKKGWKREQKRKASGQDGMTSSSEYLRTLLTLGYDPNAVANNDDNNPADIKHIVTDSNGMCYMVLNFEHLISTMLCGKRFYRLEFQFSDMALRKLIELIYSIPYHEDETTESVMNLFQKTGSNSSFGFDAKLSVPLLIDSDQSNSKKDITYGKPILVFGPNCCKNVHLSILKDLNTAAWGRF
ncbi:hypothetical protein RFI_13585, partial [Reticulomyxa filosa]